MWQYLVEHAKDYGFLGPIVGIVALLTGASIAIGFGWARSLDTWKPPTDIFPGGLDRIVGMLNAVGLFVAWFLAEPKNGPEYLLTSIYLATGALVAFLIYVGLWAYPGRFRMPRVDGDNRPTRDDVIWGGFWLWKEVRKEVRHNNPVEAILAGMLYDRSRLWPPFSLMLSAVLTAFVLIAMLVCGTLALSIAGASIQVALTGKPAHEVFSTSQVPGLSTSALPIAPNTPNRGDETKEPPK